MDEGGEDVGARQPFVFVGNHLAVDYVNTQLCRDGAPVDLLATPSDLRDWLVAAGLVPAGRPVPPVDTATWRAALGLRRTIGEALAQLGGGADRGGGVEAATATAIGAALAGCTGHFELRWDAAAEHRAVEFVADPGPPAVLAPIARAAAELIAAPAGGAVRQCERPACVLWFLDISRSGRRRWCSMRTCGNREKAAAFYRRSRSAR